MNNAEIESLWSEMGHSITGMAINMGTRMRLPVDSLLSYLNEEFFKSCRNYDPEKCTASARTFVQYQMKMRVLDFKKSLKGKRRLPVDPDIDPGSGLIPENSETPFMDAIVSLIESQDAKQLFQLILSMCDDPIAYRRSSSDKLDRAVRIAQDEFRWPAERIAEAMHDIRMSYEMQVST